MKLQEFFNTQKHISLTDIDKLDLYQNILYKQTKKTSLKRASFVYAKYGVYSMVFALLMFGLYGVYFINNNDLQDYKRFSINSNSANTVQADYIAQVINTQGNFFIEHGGILSQTNNISNGDTILLKKGSQLVFEINSGTQSKIIGPAKLIIQKTHNESYKLNLIYGDFIQMEGSKQKTQTIEVAINDITIKQQNKAQPLNFKFVKNGTNQIFQNNGANIIVSKSNGSERSTTVSKQQVVTIQNNNIKLFANIDSFTKAIEEKNISQSFSITGTSTSSGTTNKKEINLLSLLSSPQATNDVNEISRSITSTLSDSKEILDPSQDEKANTSLYKDFYSPEFKDLENAFKEGNLDSFTQAYSKVEKRIQLLYQAFDITHTRTLGEPIEKVQGLKTAITSIKNIMAEKYNIPPEYTESIQNMESLIKQIIAQGYGSSVQKETTGTTTRQ